MQSLNRRLADLERRMQPPGKITVVGMREFDWTAEQLEAAVQEAETDAEPNDIIIRVEYIKDWKNGRTNRATR